MEHIKKCLDILDKIYFYSLKTKVSLEFYDISIDELNIIKSLYSNLLSKTPTNSENRLTIEKSKIDKLISYMRYYTNIYEQYLIINELQTLNNSQ